MTDENPFDRGEPVKTKTPVSRTPPPPPEEPIKTDGKQVILGQIPSKSNCYRIITFKSKDKSKEHATLAKTKALTDYEKTFFIQCNKYRNAGIDTFFRISVDVFYPNNRSDLDNAFKILLDCLQKNGAIKNDNLCVRIEANKFVDKLNPRIEFIIEKVI